MAYSREHMLLAFGGTLFGNETWSCSLRCYPGFGDGGGFGSGTDEPPSPQAQAVADEVSAWWLGTDWISKSAQLTWVKWNRIGTNGRYVEPVTDLVEYEVPIPPAGPVNGPFPPQVSLVVTLETGLIRGLAARGRMFMPAPALSLQTDGTLSTSATAAVGTRVATLLTSLNDGVEGGRRVGVFSNTRTGADREVNGVSVGSVLDTMRSRRAQKPEVRSPVAPVTGGS